jgi:hypothetical protein
MTEKQNPEREKMYQAVLDGIRNRSRWETRQSEYYRMRHYGKTRAQKPYPGAPDLHFPLIDTNIEKLKPLFMQQIVGLDTVATFVSRKTARHPAITTIEYWFDYKVREKSNLQEEALSWVDYALMGGRAPIKVYWKGKKGEGRVQYDAIDPLYLIVPSYTKELQDADWVVHVMPFSKAAYVRSGLYKTDKDTLERLTTTTPDSRDPGEVEKRQARELREGITHDPKSENIIVWEHYKRRDDGKWNVYTYSPTLPDVDLREPMELPYDHGMVPFVDFAQEIKDKGWYSPRGIAEKLAPFEASLCHLWNQKHEAIQYYNKPIFRAEREVPSTVNLRMQPGLILPYGVVPAPMPQPPVSFDQEMISTRSIAEQLVANPDYGMGQVIDTKNRRTATEVQAIAGQSAQAGDMRARLFRMALAKCYKMHYALLLQYDKTDMLYRIQDDIGNLDPSLLHAEYDIEPKGGMNEVNRQFLLNRAVARKQLFANSPWVDQAEIDKSIMELDDPTLIKRAFRDPNLKGQDEAEDESKGIPSLLLGLPIPVKPGQNYSVRIGALLQFIEQAVQNGMVVPPSGRQALLGRLDGLLQGLESVDKNAGRKARSQITGYLQKAGLVPAQKPPANGANANPAPQPIPA